MSSVPEARSRRWAVLAAGSLASASFAGLMIGLPALGPALRDEYDLSLAQTGAIFASVPLGVTATILAWGLLTDRIGERRVLSIGLLCTAAALLLTATTDDVGELWAGLLLAGMLGSSTMSAGGRAIIGWFGHEERSRAFAVRQAAVPAGGAIAALTLPLVAATVSVRSAFLALAGVMLAAALCAAALVREPAVARATGSVNRASPARDSRLWRLSLACGVLILAQASLVGFLVLFLHDERGLSAHAAAACLAAVQIGGGLGRLWAGALSDRLGQRIRPLRTLAAVEAALLFASAALLDAAGPLLYPVLFLAGVGAMCWNSFAITAAAEISGYRRAGAGLGVFVTVITVGNAVATTAFGFLVGATSWAVAFAALGFASLAGRAIAGPLAEP